MCNKPGVSIEDATGRKERIITDLRYKICMIDSIITILDNGDPFERRKLKTMR